MFFQSLIYFELYFKELHSLACTVNLSAKRASNELFWIFIGARAWRISTDYLPALTLRNKLIKIANVWLSKEHHCPYNYRWLQSCHTCSHLLHLFMYFRKHTWEKIYFSIQCTLKSTYLKYAGFFSQISVLQVTWAVMLFVYSLSSSWSTRM